MESLHISFDLKMREINEQHAEATRRLRLQSDSEINAIRRELDNLKLAYESKLKAARDETEVDSQIFVDLV